MYILGIDTSFDDTAAAVVKDTVILSNVLSSELPTYQEWGGVVPRLARQSHIDHLDEVIVTSLTRAGITFGELSAIAVTQGPGLAITLEIGIAKAKELAAKYNKPLVAVNHLEGHLLSFLARPNSGKAEDTVIGDFLFPAMAVIVSGGTTQFLLCSGIGKYQIVGQTQDDAMGEAFDKVGRMLGLGYPAGSLVEQLARSGTPGAIVFPVPMRSVKSGDTSFSGLKTAASRIIEPLRQKHDGLLTPQEISDVALGFQTAAITHLTEKLEWVLSSYSVNSLILGGGVASNLALRKALRSIAKVYQLPFNLPYSRKLCVDNAAMIALVGYFRAKEGKFVSNIDKLDRLPNFSLERV